MKSDASDYGEGATLMRTTSRKRAQRTDRQQEAAVQADAAVDEAAGLEGRNTDAGTPFLAEGDSPGALLITSPSVYSFDSHSHYGRSWRQGDGGSM